MRTFWMRLFVVGNAGLLAVFLYFFVVFILPNANKPEAGAFVPVFAIFVALFVALIAAGLAWAGAAQRRWFWLLGAIPAVLVLLLFAPSIIYDIAHPTVPTSFVSTLVGISASILTIAAGVISFRDVGRMRRMTPVGTATSAETSAQATTAPGTRMALVGILGLLVGASVTSFAAGASASGGGSVSEAPTTTATVQAKDTKYVETALTMKNGDVLGIFVINRDSFGHSFDIDALNVHVALPANSTTAVAIKSTAAGKLEFYCAIPGHRQAGMLGTITIQ